MSSWFQGISSKSIAAGRHDLTAQFITQEPTAEVSGLVLAMKQRASYGGGGFKGLSSRQPTSSLPVRPHLAAVLQSLKRTLLAEDQEFKA